MAKFLGAVTGLLKDPPPALAFEISEAGIAVARLRPRGEMSFHPLKAGTIAASPVQDNVILPDELALAVRAIVGSANGHRKRREAALILPDHCARISVLDFDEFPSDRKEQLSLIRFRVRKSVPFDLDAASLGYWPQPAGGKKQDVVVVIAPVETISRYEAPFRAAGLAPGLVTTSALSALELVSERGRVVVAKLSGRVLTVMVLDNGGLRLVRCLELPSPALSDVGADLYPTFVYVEDRLGGPAEKLLLCGFGDQTETARRLFQAELGVEVEPVRSALAAPGENNAGLLGYLRSIAQMNA